VATKDSRAGNGADGAKPTDGYLLSLRSFVIILIGGFIGVAVGLSAALAAGSIVAGIGAGTLAGLSAVGTLDSLIERSK
jgi:hypothetical protein